MEVLVGTAALLLIGINLVALIGFGDDKRRAASGERRVPERVLLWLAALGGSAGAKLGQRLFRHKTRKQPFARLLNAIIAGQIAVLAAALWRAAA